MKEKQKLHRRPARFRKGGNPQLKTVSMETHEFLTDIALLTHLPGKDFNRLMPAPLYRE